jgi:hypothetical protein
MFEPEGRLEHECSICVGSTHACYCGSDWHFRKPVSRNSILTKDFDFLK